MACCPICDGANEPGSATCLFCGTPIGADRPPTSVDALAEGTELREGRYRVEGVLGRGGFAVTYRGIDVRRQREVAIKEFLPEGCVRIGSLVVPSGDWAAQAYEEACRQFLQEAQRLLWFDHPRIVRVVAAFEENHTAYIVLEMLPGPTLQELADDTGPLPERHAIAHAERLAEALEVVHGQGYLHLDLKPSNAILSPGRGVVLVDFGAAWEYAAPAPPAWVPIVTPGYSPLEQYGRQVRLGTYTDVYALAATLYHLLAGQPPPAALEREAGAEPVSPRALNPEVSEPVARAVLRGLDLRVTRRPTTPRAFVDLLGGGPRPTAFTAPAGRTGERWQAEQGAAVARVLFSPDGRLVAAWSEEGSARVWHTASGQEERRFEAKRIGGFRVISLANPLRSEQERWLNAPQRCEGSLAFRHDGTLAAAGVRDGTVRLWEERRGWRERRIPVLEAGATSTALDPGDRLLAAGGGDRVVRIWDLEEDRLAGWLATSGGGVRCLAFSAGGSMVAVGSEDGSIGLWDLTLEMEAHRLEGHAGPVLALAFAPDAPLLASGGWDATASLWDLHRGVEAHCFDGHTAPVLSVAFSPDGLLLASGGMDQTARVWMVE